MDKKAKRQLSALRAKLQQLEQRAAHSRRQLDDPQELAAFEKQVADVRAEIEKVKAS